MKMRSQRDKDTQLHLSKLKYYYNHSSKVCYFLVLTFTHSHQSPFNTVCITVGGNLTIGAKHNLPKLFFIY